MRNLTLPVADQAVLRPDSRARPQRSSDASIGTPSVAGRPSTLPVLIAVIVALAGGSLYAHAPKLNSVTPTGGQRGSSIELKLTGLRLDDAQEIVFYGPGLSVGRMQAPKTNSIKLTLKIAPDCRLGEHALRVRTATGVSELRTFWVGPFPVTGETEPNNDVSKPQRLTMNSTVAGVIASEDVDCFLVYAEKGKRVSAEVEAMRLGRANFDAYLAILDGQGKLLASADDTSLLLQDPYVSLLAPKDGNYIILLRDSSWGGGDFPYRLHVGSFPRPGAVFPPEGQVGETLTVKFIGDAAGEFERSLTLPDGPQEKFGVFAESSDSVAPSPNWMRIAAFPHVEEAPPNQDRAHATSTDRLPPLAFNGIISQKGEADWFRFKAKQGVALEVQVYARRLRSPLDSVLQILDEKGAILAANDDGAGADSVAKFTPAADGVYYVKVKDQLDEGGPDYVYCAEVVPVQPSINLTIPHVARNDSQSRQFVAVPRGNRFATVISAKRANYNGEVVFAVDTLPAGVTLHADTLSAKVDQIPIVFEASSDARIGGKLLALTARAPDGDEGVLGHFRHEVELVQGPNNTFYYGTQVDQLYVAVTEPAPFKVRILEPGVPLTQSGAIDLKVVAERRSGFDEPITVKMMWNPPGVGSSSDVIIPKGQTSVDYRLNATAESAVRTWKIAMLASASVGGGPVYVSSQLANLEISPPFIVGKIETLNLEAGRTGKIVCKLDQKIPFEGKAIAKLVGLPEKVTAPDMPVTKEDKEIVFTTKAEPGLNPATYRQLVCNVTIKRGAETLHQNVGGGGVLRIVPPKKSPPGEGKVAAKSGEK